MPMTATVPLGTGVLARRWRVEVNSNTYAAPTWVRLFGIEEFKPLHTPTMQKNSDYDSAGYESEGATAITWTADVKLARKTVEAAPSTYDPAQEILRAAALNLTGGNRVDLQYYEYNGAAGPKVEAYRGFVGVVWGDGGGSNDAWGTIDVKLSGQGQMAAITHPDGAAVVPVLTSVTPATGVQAGGTLHHLYGRGFFAAGVSSVASMKLGVTNVPTYQVDSDTELHFVAPAKVAGPFIIYVTNAVGESTTATVLLQIT